MLLLEMAPTSRPPVARCTAPAVRGEKKLSFYHYTPPDSCSRKAKRRRFLPSKQSNFFVSLPPIWSPDEGAKREAGESPAQSRCCKLIKLNSNLLRHCATPQPHGKTGGKRASQKTCQIVFLSVMLSRKGNPATGLYTVML